MDASQGRGQLILRLSLVVATLSLAPAHAAVPKPAVVPIAPEALLAKPNPEPSIERMLQDDEGLRLKLYRDGNRNWSIGYGRNMSARGLTQAEALYLLQNDIKTCQGDLDVHLRWWRLLNAPRQAAMLSFCYNLGIHGLKAFKIAVKHMEAGRYKDAATNFLDSRWARQVGKRAKRITYLIEHGKAPAGAYGTKR